MRSDKRRGSTENGVRRSAFRSAHLRRSSRPKTFRRPRESNMLSDRIASWRFTLLDPRRSLLRRQLLDGDVLVVDLRLRAAVDLKPDDARPLDLLVLLGV